MTIYYEPPHVNGIMELAPAKEVTIKDKLIAILEAFEPTHVQPVCDTFYLVSTYNKANPNEVINGDTAEYLLSIDGE